MAKLIDITGKAISGEWGTDDLVGNGVPVLRKRLWQVATLIVFFPGYTGKDYVP